MPCLGRVSARFTGVVLAAVLVTLVPASALADWTAPLTFPLRVNTTAKTLIGTDNRPVLIAGDAAWSLMVQLNQSDVQQYLDDRRARGFNAILVNLIEHKFSTNSPPSANVYGQQPFTACLVAPCTINNNFATPNSAYFDNVAWVVEQAYLRGMVVLLAPMYLGYTGTDEGWYNDLLANGTNRATFYGSYIGQRFAAFPNIIWVDGGDRSPDSALPEVNAVIAGIQQYDTVHLHTAHPAPDTSSIDAYGTPAWLRIDGLYTAATDCSTAPALPYNEWHRPGLAMPMLKLEGLYENEHSSTQECWLDQMYYSVLNGARGQVFGNNPIWFFGSGWQSALDSPGSQLMQHAAALFRSRIGGALMPNANIVVNGTAGTPGTGDFIAAAWNGYSALAYVPGTTPRSFDVSTALVPTPQFHAWWYDTTSGNAQDLGLDTTGSVRTFSSPTGGPWVLVLDPTTIQGAPGTPGPAVNRYRLYSPVTAEHHYTTDENEYIVLGTRGWAQEGIAHRAYTDTTPVDGVTPTPFYRLYNPGIRQHLWTTDANEYNVLGGQGWTQEGIDSYLLPSAVTGLTVPLYRLANRRMPLHLWTTDTNEYQVLGANGWTQEGIVGYVVP